MGGQIWLVCWKLAGMVEKVIHAHLLVSGDYFISGRKVCVCVYVCVEKVGLSCHFVSLSVCHFVSLSVQNLHFEVWVQNSFFILSPVAVLWRGSDVTVIEWLWGSVRLQHLLY